MKSSNLFNIGSKNNIFSVIGKKHIDICDAHADNYTAKVGFELGAFTPYQNIEEVKISRVKCLSYFDRKTF